MGFRGFAIGFFCGLMGTMLMITLFDNKFVVSFIVALIIGVVASMAED